MIWLLLRVICVFPAGAGVILAPCTSYQQTGGVSRRRGGDPRWDYEGEKEVVCFPQARG